MKYNDKYTAKLILRKSGNYIRLSMVIFITMIALLCFSFLFYLSYSEDNNKNYMDNEIVHVISANGVFENDLYRNINAKDKNELEKIIKKNHYDAAVEIFYSFTGATIEDDKMTLVIGVDKNAEHYISKNKMKDDVLYTNDFDLNQIKLSVPKIEIDEEGNINSDSSIDIDYPRENMDNNKVINYFSHGFENLKKVYVTENTYKNILKLSRKEDNDDIDKVFAESVIESAYINVEDLNDVDRIADKIKDEGYDIEYTFSAFDAMGVSLHKNGILFFIMIFFLLIVASINLVLSLMSYIDMSRKDMGVLKFLGYDNSRIYKIYVRNINKIFIMLAMVAEVCIVILTFATIESKVGGVIMAMSGGMVALLFILNSIVNAIYLKNVTKKNLLYLVKETKQFE